MVLKRISIMLVVSIGLFVNTAQAAPITINFDTLGSQNGADAISVNNIAPDLSLSIESDTFDLVSLFPQSGQLSFSLNGDSTSQVDSKQGFFDQGLGALDEGDFNDDIDGFGDNDILLFSFSQEVSIVSILFDNIFGNSDDFIHFASDSVFGINETFLSPVLDVPNIAGDDGEFFFDTSFSGSFFGIGALEADDSFRIRAITIEVSNNTLPDTVVDVPAPSILSMLLLSIGGIAFLRRQSTKTKRT